MPLATAETKARSSGPVSPRDTLAQLVSMARSQWPLLLGNIVEWYEFGVYGYLSQQMKANFFRGSALGTWCGFAVTFLARPLGGVLLGLASDRYGRKPAILFSLCGMLLATVGQGFLPVVPSEPTWDTKRTEDLGLYLLILLRLAQGIAVGGEGGSLVTLLVESAPPEHRALAAVLMPATGFGSFLLASGVTALLSYLLGPRELSRWGWRLPFLASLPPGIVALWGRLQVEESEDFLLHRRAAAEALVTSATVSTACTESARDESKSWGRGSNDFVSSHWKELLLGNAATVSCAILFYAGNVWVCSYLKAQGMEHTRADLVGCCSSLLSLIAVLPLAHLCDQVGAGTMAMVAATLTCASGAPNFALLQAFPGDLGVALLCIAVVNGLAMAASASCMFLYCAELFPTQVRALGYGLTYNLATSFFGGFAGLASEVLLQVAPLGPGLLISAGGLTSAVAIMCGMGLRSCGALRLTHIRHEPYWVLSAA